MKMLMPALVVLCLAAGARGQTIYLPPAGPDCQYNPYYDQLDDQAVARLRVLNGPRVAIFLPPPVVTAAAPAPAPDYSPPNGIRYVLPDAFTPPPVDDGLYYRKRDLLPPAMVTPPATQPSGEQGRILIVPTRKSAPTLVAVAPWRGLVVPIGW